MPTDARTAGPHRPPAPRRLRAERRRGAALLAAFVSMPVHPALCWWLAPYAARAASNRTRKP